MSERLRFLPSGSDSFLVELDDQEPLRADDAILIHLDPHLSIIRDGFALPDAATAAGQLDLFALSSVRVVARSFKAANSRERRRSA